MSDLRFVVLAEAVAGKPVEVLRVGEFVDSAGQRVRITAEDLDAFVSNFDAGAAGQEVPFDIDHERAEAAGWVSGLVREGDVLKAVPDWNELGRRLVGDRVYRYISATIDMARKVIKSLSLVNFPAVKGLAPVELMEFRRVPLGDYLQARLHKAFTVIADDLAAAGLVTVEERIELSGAIGTALEAFRGAAGAAGERTVDVPAPELYFYSEPISREGGDAEAAGTERVGTNSDERKGATMAETEAELRERLKAEMEKELAAEQARLAEMRQTVRSELEVELREQFERRQRLVEFAAEVCGGDAGLSAKPEDVVAALEALPAEALEPVQALLRSKVVDFSERGSGRDGAAGKQALPVEMVSSLRTWLDAGQGLTEFFTVNREELGAMEQYDLSGFAQVG